MGSAASVPDGAPAEQELQKISYMSSAESHSHSRKLYTHFEEAKSCGDFELAMRWNRPPNSESGPFHKKMAYLTATVPGDLRKNSEVFLRATIEKGETLPSGSAGWYLRMSDGMLVQAIEMADFLEKQEQVAQEGKAAALLEPNRPQRAFCGQGVYQGVAGKDPDRDRRIPLVSVVFAMDRDK
ncbi:MAG: hypothetical protein ACREVV_11375 [Steroidobacteraceae bacterium]